MLKKLFFSIIGLALILSVLQPTTGVEAKEITKDTPKKSYRVKLKNTKGENAGTAVLVQTSNGVLVQVEVTGLDPGFHGIHFHEKGLCETPDFKSAGGHFNPFGKEHGLKNPKGPHAGDLNNLTADARGNVNTTFIARRVTLNKGEKNSLLDKDGSALVIHSKADDQITNPAGAAGDRVVCGVIK